jgi:peptidyl-dipeptidase Dcp
MTRFHAHALAAAFSLAAAAADPALEPASDEEPTATVAADRESNPFFDPSPLPYQLPPFDRIKDDHYAPAFEKAMAQQRAEVDLIANDEREPDFENTFTEMERSGSLLNRVTRTFSNLASAHTNPTLQELERDVMPKLAAHRDSILLDGKLFARVKSLHERRGELGLDAESLRLIERYYVDFVRAGAQLGDDDKRRLKAINQELAGLQTAFAQNVLKETNESSILVTNRAELDGLSDDDLESASNAAKAAGHDGLYLIALQNTTGQPPLASLRNRALRQRIHEASINRGLRGGDFDNRELVARMARLRAERAALLGYPDHAAYVLEDSTARTREAVNRLLADLAPAAVANARAEAADMQAIIDEGKGGFQLAAWDWAYYAEKVRSARYDFDEEQLRPYLELENVLVKGVFHAANQLYGLTFKERRDLPVYHPDVRVFEVFEADGTPLALFLGDFYARPSKRGGAWMNAYVAQSHLLATPPVVANHQNIPKPPAGQPTLMTFTEVITMFHEFGHALHGMFSNVRYPRFSGTTVPRDFVEYPSQVNEMWAIWPDVLAHYALHHETGEPMPQALLEKVKAAEKFNQGFATTEYLAASLLDQGWHQQTASQIDQDVVAFEARVLKENGVALDTVPPRYRSTYFSHIFAGGYSAGYYSYLWSEVLDADSVEWFKENGGLKRRNGDHFRATLLSRGGARDAMELFRDFRGRDPRIEPLLERRGLGSK